MAELEGFGDLGRDVSFAVLRQRGRLPGSSSVVDLRCRSVGTYADGLAERVTLCTDIDEARAAAERPAEERG